MEALFDVTQKLIPTIARFRGRCPLCLYRFRVGVEEIVKVDGDWAHAECAAEEGHEVMGYA
jgi:hypothetical protein